MGIVLSIPSFLLPSSYGIYSNSPHLFPWQLHPIPSPAGCLDLGSTNKRNEGEIPLIRSRSRESWCPCHGQATLNPYKTSCPASPHLSILALKALHSLSLSVPLRQGPIQKLPPPGSLQAAGELAQALGFESLFCHFLALRPLAVTSPLRALSLTCRTGILILPLCLPRRLNNMQKMPDTGKVHFKCEFIFVLLSHPQAEGISLLSNPSTSSVP